MPRFKTTKDIRLQLSLQLELDLHTDFHLGLADPTWEACLKSWLETYVNIRQGVVVISSDYGAERFMGERSVVRYRFRGDYSSPGPALENIAEFEIEYKPDLDTFLLRSIAWGFKWNRSRLTELLGAQEADLIVAAVSEASPARRDLPIPIPELGIQALPCSTGPLPLVLTRAESMDSRLIVLDGQDSFMAIASELTAFTEINAFRLARQVVPILLDTVAFEEIWLERYGPRYKLERLGIALLPKSQAEFKPSGGDEKLDSENSPFALTGSDGLIQLHIMDWLDRKSPQEEPDLVKIETLAGCF